MKQDIILSGVGGQGVLSLAAIIAMGAMKQGLLLRQSEIHGMSQRGGGVQVHLRISDMPIESGLIPKKSANFILSMEPLESLRYLEYLAEDGIIITSIEPVLNMLDYPEEAFILKQIQSMPQYSMIDVKNMAIKAGAPKSMNIVLAGAVSKRLIVNNKFLEEAIREKFKTKGEQVVNTNIKAFQLGRDLSFPVNMN